MALPEIKKIIALESSSNGDIWCKVTANKSINADKLEFSQTGDIWWGMGGEIGSPPTAVKIFLGSIGVPKLYVGSAAVSKVYFGSVEI